MYLYIDILFIDNFCIDFCLLVAAIYTVKGKINFWRVTFTALLGTLLAICYTLFTARYNLPKWIDICIKYGVALLLPCISIKLKTVKSYVICSVTFVAYMFTLAGFLTALFLKTDFVQGESLTYTIYGLPTGLLLLGGFLFILMICWLIRRIQKKIMDIPNICHCSIQLAEKVVHLEAFVDTGNRVQDADGNFVVFVEKDALKEFVTDIAYTVNSKNTLEIQTVAGKKICSTMKVDMLKLYYKDKQHIHKNVTVAIYEEKLVGEYMAIVSPLCFL